MSVLYDLYKLQLQLQLRYGVFTSKLSNIKQTFKIYRENKDENKIIILGCFGGEQAGHHHCSPLEAAGISTEEFVFLNMMQHFQQVRAQAKSHKMKYRSLILVRDSVVAFYNL